MLLMSFITVSCKKTEYSEKEIQKDLLIEQVSNIVNLSINPSVPDDFMVINCNNPFDAAGVITSDITYDFLIKAKDKKSSISMLKSELINETNRVLWELNLNPDTLNYDDVEYIIKDFLIDIYLKEGFEIFVLKSKEIENIVNTDIYFNENQKKRVLLFSSVLRHNISKIKEFFIENKMSKAGPSWEDCFVDKLRELQECDNCLVERVLCIFAWPTCLGVKAIDCAIAIF